MNSIANNVCLAGVWGGFEYEDWVINAVRQIPNRRGVLDGDGIRTATGWYAGVASGDSIKAVVGVAVELGHGFKAVGGRPTGIDATGHHGLVAKEFATTVDAAIAVDTNQDGISQTGELQSLSDAGITAISLDANTQGIGSFTQNGVPHTAQNVNLSSNTFYREFTDNPVVTAAATALPQMQGTGLVRDLREAMSLGSTPAQDLQTKLTQYVAATTREAQRALLDGLLTDCVKTSGRSVNSTGHYSLASQDGRRVTDLSTIGKVKPITIDLIASCACQTGATRRFDWRRRCHATHQSPLMRRFERSRTKCAHASCARLTGQKGLGGRMEAAWALGGDSQAAGELTRLGVDEFTLQVLHSE